MICYTGFVCRCSLSRMLNQLYIIFTITRVFFMSIYTQTKINVVVIGKMNPQILNHNWLLKEKIIPPKLLLSGQDILPFSNYISTPPYTTITYGKLSFSVELNKFILEANQNDLDKGMFSIVKKYFSKLSHTPVHKLGFNLHATVKFDSTIEEKRFINNWISSCESLKELFNDRNIQLGFSVISTKGKVCYQFNCIRNKIDRKNILLHCNREFDVSNTNQLVEYLSEAGQYISQMNKLNRSLSQI